jgi:hypothetical protein
MANGSPAEVGDVIEIHGHRLGEPGRKAEILEVIGVGEHEHYRVRWDDGHESIFTPGSDAVVRHARHGADEPVLDREP